MRKAIVVAFVAALVLLTSACGLGGGTSAPNAAQKAQKASDKLQGQVYQSKHNVEFRNYNLRQKMSDDPSTILWCTFVFPNTGMQPITVPIAGKLTSSGKRPYQGNNYAYSDAGAVGVSGERPGPDLMFGTSSEYRYGFDPTLTQYSDFYNLPSYCTNVPTVFQANQTTIVVKTDPTLAALSLAAQQAIKDGKPVKALNLLKTAGTKKGK